MPFSDGLEVMEQDVHFIRELFCSTFFVKFRFRCSSVVEVVFLTTWALVGAHPLVSHLVEFVDNSLDLADSNYHV